VPADPATGRDPVTGQPIGTTGRFTFYSLRENRVILSHTEANRADSASNKWDIAFRSSTILVNGNGVGGGQGGAQVLESSFDDVVEAPSSGYSASSIGLESSSSVAWGTYNPATMTVFPLADRTIVLQTGNGSGYAKVKVLSYYQGAPQVPNPFQDLERYYTFEFVLQNDGRRFE
ncbi:MAG TPA: HmuY family protein, partial [Rhodothermales bacterium]